MDLNESQLQQLKDGRPDVFELFVSYFESPLYRWFLCDHRDHHLAQEQTAETFAQLVRSLPSMRGGPQQLRAFVFGVARHVQRRNWRRRRREPNRMPIELALQSPDPALSPSEVIAEQEQAERVLELIRDLDQPTRNVLVLRLVEEFSLAEIVNVLGMPLGTVKSHLHRGRAELKERLSVEEYHP